MKTFKYGPFALSVLMLLQSSCSLNQPAVIKTEPIERTQTAPTETEQLYPAQELKQVSNTATKIKPVRQSKESYESGLGSGSMKKGFGSAVPMGAAVTDSSGVYQPYNQESYDGIVEGKENLTVKDPLSTFSVDVDTASYSNMRRFLLNGQTPPADAIRIEELINYFSYDYTAPTNEPFSVNLDMTKAPWDSAKKIVRIGIKGKEIKIDKRPASNLVFLVDVSGSMDSAEKLPLVKSALAMMVDKLDKNDKISIVVYAGAAGLVLKPTNGKNKTEILRSLDQLKAGGSTNGAQGIELAYKTASDEFIRGGVNRVIMATDGDFNVGTTSREELLKLVTKNAEKNIYLSILGFGMGNYKDGMMETLSNKGNGNYAYIDNQSEARNVMIEQLSGTLVTIAKDVKIQVEFNPTLVSSYRLIGYENRVLNHEDFNDDKKDAGDIGAGHTVTALYEIVPVGSTNSNVPVGEKTIDTLKYSKIETQIKTSSTESSKVDGELLTVKLRFKRPDGVTSQKLEFVLRNSNKSFEQAAESMKFATAVAMFGMKLRQSEHMKNIKTEEIKSIASKSKGSDNNGYKKEFIELIEKYESIHRETGEQKLSYTE